MKTSVTLCAAACAALLGCQSGNNHDQTLEFSDWGLRPEPDGRIVYVAAEQGIVTCSGHFMVKKPSGTWNPLLYLGAFAVKGDYRLWFESKNKAAVTTPLIGVGDVEIVDDQSMEPVFTATLVRFTLNEQLGAHASIVQQKARDVAEGRLIRIKSKIDFAGYLLAILRDADGSIPELPVADINDTQDLRKYGWYHQDVTLARFLARSRPQVIVE